MKPDDTMRVRRAVMRLTQKQIGEAVTITCDSADAQQFMNEVSSFAKLRKIGVSSRPQGVGVLVTRIELESQQPATRWAAMDKLTIGQSHVFEVPPHEHQKVRLAAHTRARAPGGMRFKCQRHGDAIKVTRIALDAQETGTTDRWTYDMGPLRFSNGIKFEGAARFAVVRQTAAKWALREGWVLITRTDGNAITVYRLDNLNVLVGSLPGEPAIMDPASQPESGASD